MNIKQSFVIILLFISCSSQSMTLSLQKIGHSASRAIKKPYLTRNKRMLSTQHHETVDTKQAIRAILAFGTIGTITYGSLWLHNEDRVHTTVSNALAHDRLTKARLLLLARQKLLRDNRPLSQLQYSCPTSIPQCRHNLLVDVKRVIKQRDAPECTQLFKNRTESGDLRQLLAAATAEQRIETEKSILEADSLQ